MEFITLFDMARLRTGYGLCQHSIDLMLTLPQDHMERFWSNSIFKYLRVEPEDHYFLLTEPVSAAIQIN